MRFAVRFITVLVLVLTLGLHWALLQTMAWTGMVIVYSQENSFRDAVSMTFDGEHPCALCKTIKQGRAEERRQSQKPADLHLKLEFPLPVNHFVFIVPPSVIALPASEFFPNPFHSKPPTPPPRSSAV